ncbi:T9SS type A sorting domain-containing protein [Hymenobacter antarcticus]|uniref:Por secretion system C-terminal sorting domain-containing protein n=1 Tax=Hymenobacter antarcticus TaxID=486270 RepID=A0ABP7PP01_9BACT
MRPLVRTVPPGLATAHSPWFRWGQVLLLFLLMGLAPGAYAQSPGPDGGTLSPATSTVCSGFNSGTLTLTGYTGSIVKYQANSGSGYVDIANTAPTYTFSNLQTTTSFRAVVQNGANAPVTSTVATVTVNQPPTATINSQGPTRFCQQGTIYLVAGPSGNFTYQFLRNGINIAGATSQVYSALITNSASYSVRVTDAAGCSAVSASIQIQVQPQNVVNLSTNTPTTFCQGGSVLLSANVTGSGAANYTYQFLKDGNQIPGATNSTYSATTSGTYTVVVDNPATCSATSNAVTVTVTPPTVATISYPAASYCQSGATNPTATVTPTGGTFSSTTGLSLNTNTGAINLAQSQPGTYTVAYTSGGSCPGTATASITITVAPTAGFSYAGGSRCAGTAGTLTPTAATGATAGTYSATPAGLSLNAGTGAIDLSQSQPGSYTVTNTVAAANGCAAVSATTSVVLTAQPVATLAAGGATTFCQGGSVVLTASGGAAGATYQFLNNGQPVAGATSATYTATAGGSYSVVITNPGGCASTSAPTTVTVNPQTVATFSYSAAAYCQNSGTTPTPTITGTMGGAFSSAPAGLSGNASTGAINLAASTPGTYTVTYSVGGPCPSTATVSVTVTAPAVATFSYGAATYCVGGTNPTPTLASGASAGTFTSTAGLVLNAGTGAIDLAQSQPGTYTVTNTVAATGGCPSAAATTQVSISTVPVASLAASGPTTFCQGGSVTLTANGGGAGSTYQFLNNGQPISGATSATFVASASGSYSVVITNAGVCSATSAATSVTVNPIATPTLSYAAASFCQGAGTASPTVSISGGSFSASGTGLSISPTTGVLNLGQSQPGTYTVTYVAGTPCPGSTTASVTITATPSAAFAYAGGTTFCPTAANPTPTVSGAAGGTFSAPAGLVIDPATGTINLQTSTAGTYAVTYSVAGSCPASSTVSVTLTTAPVATFAYASATGYCAGAATAALPTFSGGGSAGTFSAAPAGLSVNLSTGAIDLMQSQPGTYTVTNTIAASGACSAVSATATVTINAAPVASLTAGGATTFCAGGSVLLTAPAGAGLTYQFLNNGQPISGATAASYTATAAGSYAVTVTNASGCAATSAATTVTVNPATTATFTYPAASFCRSNSLVTTPTVTGTAGGTFAAPSGLSLNASTGAITPSASTAGTYTVTYSVGGPCPSTGTASVTITAPAVATFSYANSSYCATGTTAATLATGSAAGTFTAATGLSVNAATGAINLSASTPGTYTVTNTVAASGGCAAVSATATLTINALPAQPTLTASGAVLSVSPVAGATYQFYLNGVAIAGATNATYTATQNGSYTVMVTGANGCASLPSAPLTITVTATRAGLAGVELTAYPNPTTGHLTITMAGPHSRARLVVLNALGQEVLTSTLAATATARELDLSQLATGVYVLKATTTEGTLTRRIVRQ